MDTPLALCLLTAILLVILPASFGDSQVTTEQLEHAVLVPEKMRAALGHDETLIAGLQEFRVGWFRDMPNSDMTGKQTKWVSRLGKSEQRSSFFGASPSPALRKEYRQLTEKERQRFHAAVQAMNENLIDGVSEYHLLVKDHREERAPASHEGAAFLPWHREYLTRFERALRRHDPSVTLPYWDSQLDMLLTEPRDSIIWSDDYLGNNVGNVTSGPFANWTTLDECGSALRRNVRPYRRHYLYSDWKINHWKNARSFEELIGDQWFEGFHGSPHLFVGGQMQSPECSPSDPIFWMHHAFVDLLWEEFRQNQQETDLETEYPINSRWLWIGGTVHNPNATMNPFGPLRNIDGMSVKYTRDEYNYAPRPTSCTTDSQCGHSLWCHDGRCKSKVKLNGICNGFPINSTAPCERGKCVLSIDTYLCMDN